MHLAQTVICLSPANEDITYIAVLTTGIYKRLQNREVVSARGRGRGC
jgi:hypothetical protein